MAESWKLRLTWRSMFASKHKREFSVGIVRRKRGLTALDVIQATGPTMIELIESKPEGMEGKGYKPAITRLPSNSSLINNTSHLRLLPACFHQIRSSKNAGEVITCVPVPAFIPQRLFLPCSNQHHESKDIHCAYQLTRARNAHHPFHRKPQSQL